MHRDDTREHELFCAWVAGFVDGEGCLTITRSRNKVGTWTFTPVVVIANTVRAPLDEIHRRAGVGSVNTRPRPAPFKTQYQYTVGSQNAQRFIRAIRPYLRVKGAQADILLRFVALDRSTSGGRRADQRANYAVRRAPQVGLYEEVRALNKRGMPLDDPLSSHP